MIVFYSCSKLFEKYIKISIESVLKHNPTAEIIINAQEKLDLPYTQINIKMDRVAKGLEGEYGWCANAKLFLTQLPYDKMIHLGADTICQGSLREMWDMPCDYINACESHSYGKTQAQELGIKHYINVDSMVMNLKSMREDNFTEKAFERDDYPVKYWCNEETIVNGRFHDKINLLPQKYNYAYNRKYDNPMPYNEAVILHFIGQQKEAMLNFERI